MPNETDYGPSPLAALIGGGKQSGTKNKANKDVMNAVEKGAEKGAEKAVTKRASRKQKVDGMRQYTTGRSVGDFIASQSENPFLRSMYAYSKTIQQRREMAKQKSQQKPEGTEGEEGAEGEEGKGNPKKRTGVRTIQTFRRQLKTVERVTADTQKDTKEVIKAITEIKKGILGIKSVIQNLKSSLDKITSSITPSPENSIAASAARMYDTAGADTKELLKPIDVKSSGGDDYMYYRGAPQGRQFYKKGKGGTAGAIASKELSQDLYAQLDKKLSMISAQMNGGMDETGKVLAPKDYGQLKEVDDKEEVEKLEKALEGALRKVLPSALAEAGVGDQTMIPGGGGGGGFGGIGGALLRGAGAILRGGAAVARGAFKGIKNIGSKIGNFMRGGTTPVVTPTMPTGTAAPPTTVPAASKAATAGATAAPAAAKAAAAETAGATAAKAAPGAAADAATKAGTTTAAKAAGKGVLKSALKKIPIIGAVAGLGFAASRLMAGDKTGAALEAASGLAGTLPGLGTAASVGLDATLAARDAGLLGKTAMSNPLKSDIPATIMERSSAQLNAAKGAAPPVIVNAPSAPPAVPPPPPPKQATGTPLVRNPDDAFIRATSRDFYHPASVYK